MEGYNQARKILEEQDEQLTRLAEALLEREVLDANQIAAIAEGRALEPMDREVSAGGDAVGQEAKTGPDGDAVDEIENEKDKSSGVLPEPGNQPA